MQDSPFLLNLLNAIESKYVMSGTTTLRKTNKQFLSLVHSQPFVLVTQFTEGALLLKIDYTSYRIDPGQALIIPANVKYTLQLLDDKTVTHWLNLNYTLFEHFSVFDFIETPFVTSVEIGNQIGQLQAEFVELMHVNQIDNSMALSSVTNVKQRMFSILGILLSISRYKAGSFENMDKFQRFKPVFNYIEEHIAEKIKVSQLAKLMYVSTSYFYREFQESFDVSPMQYIQSQRLKKAQYLLATSDLTVKEIANLVGYDNAFPFIRFFKSMDGANPGDYRKMMLNSLSNYGTELDT